MLFWYYAILENAQAMQGGPIIKKTENNGFIEEKTQFLMFKAVCYKKEACNRTPKRCDFHVEFNVTSSGLY